MLAGVLGATVAGVAAFGGVMAAVGMKSASAAMEFERFTSTIGGGLGSLEKGKEVMAALEGYAQRSAFGLNDLAAASTQMVAAGLDLAQVLPMAERFALIIGGTNPEGLMQVAGALARIKGGSFGEAMEIFRRAGVSADDLRGAGITVGKGGQIQGSPTQVMAAIERISQGRPKDMADAVSKTSSVAVSNAQDAVDSAFRNMGATILGAAVPALNEFSTNLNGLVKSGALDGISNAFSDIIAAITGGDSGKGLLFAIGATTTAMDGFRWWVNQFTRQRDGGSGSDPWYKQIFDFIIGGGLAGRVVAGKVRSDMAVAENGAPLSDDELKKYGVYRDKGGIPHTAGKPADAPVVSKTVGYLAEIAENTKLTKQDLRRLAFGAGAAEAGVTAVEMSKVRRKRGGGTMGGEIGAIIQAHFDAYIRTYLKEQGMAR